MAVVQRIILWSIAYALSGMTSAQDAWPDRPIQLIVPFRAGGGVDVIARPFAEMFGELLHQSIVVVPRGGAAGTIGAGVVAVAKPDGYTLAFTTNGPITVQPHVISTLAYTPENLVPLCQVFAVQYVLAARPDSPYKTLSDQGGSSEACGHQGALSEDDPRYRAIAAMAQKKAPGTRGACRGRGTMNPVGRSTHQRQQRQ